MPADTGGTGQRYNLLQPIHNPPLLRGAVTNVTNMSSGLARECKRLQAEVDWKEGKTERNGGGEGGSKWERNAERD